MKNIPKKIYLNFGFDKEEIGSNADFNDMTNVLWSDGEQNTADIKYIISEQTTRANMSKAGLINEEMAKDYARLKRDYTMLRQDFRKLKTKQLIISDSKQRERLIAFCDSLNGYDIKDLAKSKNWLVVDKFLKSN